MQGWKTWAAVVLLVAGAAAMALGMSDIATTIYSLAVPMAIAGLGHKLDKVWGILHLVAKGLDSAATAMEKGEAAAPAPEPPKAA